MLLFILATIGLTNIIVHGKIMDVIHLRPLLKRIMSQKWFEMLECYECAGFWVGMLCGLMLVSYNPFVLLACGWAGSVLAQTYTDLMYLVRSKIEFEVEDESSH